MPFAALTPRIPIPDIVQRYSQGESVQDLATESHVNRRTLYRWMLKASPDAYEELVTDCLVNRIADADALLASAIRDSHDDHRLAMCRIVQARETCKFHRMDLERRRPALYGMKTGLAIDQQITVTVQRNTKKYVKRGKPVRTTSPSKGAVDITPVIRHSPIASASADSVNTVRTPSLSTPTESESLEREAP